MNRNIVAILGAIALGGCADKTPLVFVSKTSVGVEVSAPGTGTGEFGASIGINTLDAAYVPVVEITSGQEKLHQIKSGESLSPQQRDALATKLVQQIDREAQQLTAFQNDLANAGGNQAKAATAQQQIDHTQQRVQTLSAELTNVLSRNDALSVFSAFDSNTLLRKDSAGQGVGKVFATGLAAQHVARSFKQQELELATCKALMAPSAAKLAGDGDDANKALALKLLEACK